TGHDSSVLIFDELEYEPFTENRRRASGMWKIPRSEPPAMPSNNKNNVIRAGIPACASCVKCLTQRKGLMLFEDLDRFGTGQARQGGPAVAWIDHFHRAP